MTDNKRNLWILFFTLVVVMLGFGIIIPIMPFYVTSFGASGSTLGLLMATYGTMQFIFAPIWGTMSDRYGRKRILLVGVLGNVLSQLILGFSSQLWMLFAARLTSGILSSATLPTAMAFASDSTGDRDRSGAMGLMGAAMSVGMVLGPGLGGLLAGRSLSTPFFLAALLSAIAFVLVLAALPESLPPERRQFGQGMRNPLQRLGDMARALRGPIGFLFLLAFLLSFGLTNFEAVFGLYALQRFGYGPQQVGSALMVMGVLSALAQGVLTGLATRRWGEVAVIRAALISTAAGFLLMLTASSYATVLLTVGYFVVSNAMIGPSVAALISKRTIAGQGMAMGLNNAFMSLGRIAGPVWAGMVFDINLRLPFFTGALIFAAGFLLSWFKLSREPGHSPEIASALSSPARK
ncbi:MAG: MFS transporter [Anaerolineae bacterium]